VTEFSRAALEAAFVKGRIIPVGRDPIGQLGSRLRVLEQQYRARKAAPLQDLNAQLARLKEIIPDLWDIEALVFAFDPEVISRLSRAVQRAIDFLEYEKEQRKRRGDDAETTLFIDLRNIYLGLGGKPGISDDGPLYRFAKACAELIDQSIILPQAQTLRKALNRRKEPPSYVVVKQSR
jgi:hypothetical protein